MSDPGKSVRQKTENGKFHEMLVSVFYFFRSELGIRYFRPFSLFANLLLQCSYSLSLLRYFSEICNTLFSIHYSLFATSFEQCNRLYISELFKFYAGLWIRIDFNLDPVPALDFWGFTFLRLLTFFKTNRYVFQPFSCSLSLVFNKKKVANSGSETLQYATASPLHFKSAILLIFSLFAK
jgi:hypothetical protein